MDEKHKVSLIVAIYNSEPFLRKLLESLVHQTYNNLEIILVDDPNILKDIDTMIEYKTLLDERK